MIGRNPGKIHTRMIEKKFTARYLITVMPARMKIGAGKRCVFNAAAHIDIVISDLIFTH